MGAERPEREWSLNQERSTEPFMLAVRQGEIVPISQKSCESCGCYLPSVETRQETSQIMLQSEIREKPYRVTFLSRRLVVESLQKLLVKRNLISRLQQGIICCL